MPCRWKTCANLWRGEATQQRKTQKSKQRKYRQKAEHKTKNQHAYYRSYLGFISSGVMSCSIIVAVLSILVGLEEKNTLHKCGKELGSGGGRRRLVITPFLDCFSLLIFILTTQRPKYNLWLASRPIFIDVHTSLCALRRGCCFIPFATGLILPSSVFASKFLRGAKFLGVHI